MSTILRGFLPGNKVTTLQSGEAFFPAIEAAFDRAKHEIHLATYIYKNDTTGEMVANALARATQRGVKVFLLLDGYGSKELPSSMLHRLRADGINVLIFRPHISPWSLRRERLRRMHRKVIVVDREIAFVGGINIIDDCKGQDDTPCRYDFCVTVEGPLVDVIRLSAQRLWAAVSWRSLHKRALPTECLPVAKSVAGSMNTAFLMRDNFHHRRDIEAAYMHAINKAEREIILAHAYFLPGIEFRHALISAAKRGVKVILLLQGQLEYFVEFHAARALYGNLLEAGIEIHEYRKGALHAKVAAIDGHWTTVGSSNIDPFSLLLAREANVVIDDKDFGATLAESLKKTLKMDCRQILTHTWKQQFIGWRVVGWFCYGLLRLMMGISGYDCVASPVSKRRFKTGGAI